MAFVVSTGRFTPAGSNIAAYGVTIALGTPLRFCIAYWFPILVFVVVWNYEVVWAVSQGAIALSTGLQMLTFPDFATRFIGFWYAACLLSDIAHLILDKYNPIEWLIGKR